MAFGSEAELRKLTPRMHRTSKPEFCGRSSGLASWLPSYSVSFLEARFLWLRTGETFGAEGYRGRGGVVFVIICAAAEPCLFLTTLPGFPDVANKNTRIKSKIKSNFIKI